MQISVNLTETVLCVACSNNNIYILNLTDKKEKPIKALNTQIKTGISCMRLSYCENYLLVGMVDGVINSYDTSEFKFDCSFREHFKKGKITNILAVPRPLNLQGLNAN